jgi:Right handed beta helix region
MRSSFLLAAAAGLCLAVLTVDAAQAQPFTRTWVSGLGLDSNPCTRDLPCSTFAVALANTTVYGEINCVDAADFGTGFTLTINKSVTIECNELAAMAPVPGAATINIDVDFANPNDPLRTVRLRGLRISGAGVAGTAGIRLGFQGILIVRAVHVFLEDMLITQFSGSGISDLRAVGGNLYIRNTVVRDNGGTGIVVLPASGSVDALIDNSHINRNNFGLSAGANSRVMVNRSVFMGNAVQGAHADAGGKLSIDRSVINGNSTGVGGDAGSTVRLANTDIMFNGASISGAVLSFTNNRIVGGTSPTAIPPPTSDTGQQ